MSKTTVRDLELRVVALELSQEQILTMLTEIGARLGRVEDNTGVLSGYVQNVRGGWKVLATIGALILGAVAVVGFLLKLARGA